MSVDVVLISRQPAWLAGVGLFLTKSPRFRVVGAVSEFSALVGTASQPEVVLLDFDRNYQVQTVRDVCAAFPNSKVVVIAGGISPEVAFQIRETGVAAILSSTMDCQEYLDALDQIVEGYVLFDAELMGEVSHLKKIRLTPREGQLVSLLAQGLKNKEIATALDLTEGTVKVYLSKLYQKVGAKDRFELALFGIKNMSGERPAGEHGTERAVPPAPELNLSGALGSLAVRRQSAYSYSVPRTLIA